jgi:hypothetical protein
MSITFTPAVWDGATVNMTAAAIGPDAPKVNVHGGNAATLLDLLGFDPTPDGGEATAEDFLGRILIARALLDLQVDDEQGQPAAQDGNWHWGERRAGYLAGRLHELQEVAEWASVHGAAVCWG